MTVGGNPSVGTRLPAAVTAHRSILSRWGVLIGLTGAVGVVLRVWVYRSQQGTPNSDEAIVGLMVRHILHGQLTTFYWGQPYGGSQEALLTAPIFLIAGSGWLALRIVPILLNALAALLVWRVGRRTIGEPAARVAGALFWIWPAFNVFYLVHQFDFYASDVVYCALLLLLALRVTERPDRLRVGAFGLALGLAFWQTSQIVPVAVPMIVWVIWREPRALRQLPVAVSLALLGALPWLIWNAGHGWQSLSQTGLGDYLRSLRLLASPTLPMMVGLRAPYSAQLLVPSAAAYLIYAALVLLFVYTGVNQRKRTRSLLYFVVAVFPFVFALSPKTLAALGRPRYITVLTPLLVLLVAQVATRYWRAVALIAVATLVSVVTLHRMNVWFNGVPGTTTNARGLGPRHAVQWVPRNIDSLISALERLKLGHVYADYWLAYRLDFDSRERIVAVENAFRHVTYKHGQAIPTADPLARSPVYQRKVERARHGFVFYRQTVGTVPIVGSLIRHGYRRYTFGEYVVYAPSATTR